MILVGKVWDKGAISVARPSCLGNPFYLSNVKDDKERDSVCDKYQEWFDKKIKEKNPEVLKELRRLFKLAQQGDLILGCYCAPRRCHAYTIKKFLDEKINAMPIKSVMTSTDMDALEKLLVRARDKYTNTEDYSRMKAASLPKAIADLPVVKRNIINGVLEFTDVVYDGLEDAYRKMRPKSPFFQKVGAPVPRNRDKVALNYFMGSLNKIMPEKADAWLIKNKGPYVVSDKLDGMSILFEVTNGVMRAFTRGEGDKGQEITAFLPHLRLPKNIPKNMAARGEAIIPPSVFNAKWKRASAEDKKKFKNPRNMVAGILNRKLAHEGLADVDVIFHELIEPRMKPSEGFNWLKSKGFPVPAHIVVDTLDASTLSKMLKGRRAKSKYEIDGLVVALDKKSPVNVSAAPSWMVSFKENLAEDTAVTKIKSVTWEVTRRNRIAPTVQIEPVDLKGITITNASAFNARFVVENKLGPGAIIRIQRSKDVIPDIVEVIKPAAKPQLPTGVKYKWDENKTFFLVEGEHDLAKVKSMVHFFTTLGVDGFKTATAQRLFDAGFTTLDSIMQASAEDFMELDGFQKTSATKLYNGIQKAIKKVPIDKLMYASSAFGLNFGPERLSQVVKAYPKLDCTLHDVVALPGFQIKTAKAFMEGVKPFKRWLKAHPYITYTKPVAVKVTGASLKGITVIFTGFRNKALEELIVKNGGSLKGGMGPNTILLAKDPNAGTIKLEKAQEKGAKIMSELQFRNKFKL